MGEHGYRRTSGRFTGQIAAMVVAAGLTAVAFLIPNLLPQETGGGGKLTYLGKTYEFRMTGLDQSGDIVGEITSTGQVYNLTDLAHFPGVYGEARVADVLADASRGELWLENDSGVVISLDGRGAGQLLSMATDSVRVELE